MYAIAVPWLLLCEEERQVTQSPCTFDSSSFVLQFKSLHVKARYDVMY